MAIANISRSEPLSRTSLTCALSTSGDSCFRLPPIKNFNLVPEYTISRGYSVIDRADRCREWFGDERPDGSGISQWPVSKEPATERTAVLPVVSDVPPLERRGSTTFLAAIGLVWFAVSVVVIARWVGSDHFTPAPKIGPDGWNPGGSSRPDLRGHQSRSVLLFIWFSVIKPVRDTGRLSLDGRFVIGGLVCFVADAFLNVQKYLFAWNSGEHQHGCVGEVRRSTTRTRPSTPSRWSGARPCTSTSVPVWPIVACCHAKKVRAGAAPISKVALFTGIFVFEFCSISSSRTWSSAPHTLTPSPTPASR